MNGALDMAFFISFNTGPVSLVSKFPKESFVPFPTVLVQIVGHFIFPVEMVPRNHSLANFPRKPFP
jgi:hypothetical protein